MRNAVVASPARTTGCETSQRRNGRFVVDAHDLGLPEGVGEQLERLARSRPWAIELRDHRVVREPDLVTLLDARVDPHRRSACNTL